VIRVTEILTDGKTPSIGPRPKKERAPAEPKEDADAA
jgi:large subunit ribosomal protein L21